MLDTTNETNPMAIKDIKKKLTVLACVNAAGSHSLKLLVIRKLGNPQSLSCLPVPVFYYLNKSLRNYSRNGLMQILFL